MSTDTIETPTAYVRYWRKSTPTGADEYDKHEASISVPLEVPPEGPSSKEFLQAAAGLLADVKIEVWEALGVEFEVLDGKLAEKPKAPAPRPQAPAGRPFQAPAPGGNGAAGDHACGLCGNGSYNNTLTPKRNPKGPDFKCKSCGAAMWLKDDGTEGAWKASTR